MKSISSQVHVYELRVARRMALRIAWMVARDVWFYGVINLNELIYQDPFCTLSELSVKESNGVEKNGQSESTVFTFRFEGGTVVRISMEGRDDKNYGFQWNVAQVRVRYYQKATDSAYPALAGPKKELILEKPYFWQEGWINKPLPTS